ncbi:MAG TPA: hypothetical protein VES69_11335, partial [Pyrinomonadaceae bacterium]|nr:hypothetical protein [Pyrinomonadaceae bacterium]
MNSALGNIGKTVSYTEPLEVNSVDQRESLRELVQDIDAGRVEQLVILGGNPAYNTPADLKLDQNRLFKTRLRVHLSSHKDETSELCHWHIPEAHYLESWGDTRSFDGTATIVQPLIEPLYGSKTAHEVLAVFSEQYDRKAYDIVRDYWRGAGSQEAGRQEAVGSRQTAGGRSPSSAPQPAAVPTVNQSAEFEAWWRKSLHDGFVPNSALPPKTFSIKTESRDNINAGGRPALPARMSALPAGTPASPAASETHPASGGYEVVFRTDPSIFDGRFANNGWLQELPKPLTKLTWDNAALVSPNTARRLGLENTIGWKGGEILVDNITIQHRGQSVTCPTWIMPGQPDDVITLHLGYGRQRAGRVGNKRGFNAYTIRTSDSPWTAAGVKVDKAPGQFQLAVTQLHFNMEGRDILRTNTLEEYLKEGHGDSKGEHGHEKTHVPAPDETLYGNEHKYEGYAWGMAIDANSCVGCNACIVACQSENNIPIVGKEQVVRSREMHWLRVDTYFQGHEPSNPEGTYFMPVP